MKKLTYQSILHYAKNSSAAPLLERHWPEDANLSQGVAHGSPNAKDTILCWENKGICLGGGAGGSVPLGFQIS